MVLLYCERSSIGERIQRPIFKHFVDSQALRGIRAFLSEAGVVHRMMPGKRLEREARSKDREIARLRRKLAKASEELAALKGAGTAGNRRDEVPIFFVVGAARSGTTWLRRMLDQHPEVLCRGEGRFFGRHDRN